MTPANFEEKAPSILAGMIKVGSWEVNSYLSIRGRVWEAVSPFGVPKMLIGISKLKNCRRRCFDAATVLPMVLSVSS